MKYYDAFCRVMPPISRASVLPLTSTEMVKYGKMLQSVDVKSSKVVSVLLSPVWNNQAFLQSQIVTYLYCQLFKLRINRFFYNHIFCSKDMFC